MPSRVSAGLLMYRAGEAGLEAFLVHPGGPFFRNKDRGAWSLPKGEVAGGEDLLETARREFEEELGVAPEAPEFLPLGEVTQKGGKRVHAWAFAGDWDPGREVRSNTFTIEYPPRSGRSATFPEIDRAAFFPLPAAREKINPAQAAFLDRLAALLEERGTG